MAGVRDKQLLKFTGWAGGVNNVDTETAVGQSELREAVNVDLSPEGKPRRRMGYERVIETTGPHSLFATAGAMFSVVGGALTAYGYDLTPATLRAGLGPRPVSYVEAADGRVYWTNESQIRCVSADITDEPLWVECPGQPSVSAHATGGLFAGQYQVAITYFDAFGRESGSSMAAEITVTEGQGILVSNIPANTDAATVRIYVSDVNGDTLLAARDIPAGTTQWIIGAGQRGKKLETQFLEPLPAGQIIRAQNGRVFVARGPLLLFSEPFRYGLHNPLNFARYNGDLTLVEPCGSGPEAGMFIGTAGGDPKACTYYVSGPDPKAWTNRRAYAYGAVPGTGQQVPASVLGIDAPGLVPYWLASNGIFCAGLPGGRVIPLTDRRFVTPANAERGATLLREQNGIRQLLTALLGGNSNAMAASDSAVATIRRHDVTTD